MSGQGLTPGDIKSRHTAEIKEAGTFVPRGLDNGAAKAFLDTPAGSLFFQRLAEADPSASIEVLRRRAIEQLASSRELPRIEVIDEPLVKIAPAGVSDRSLSYTPYFAKRSEFEAALARGERLNDFFGLPIKSEAQAYDLYEIRPKAPTEVFVNRVAPTSELDGQVTRSGGAIQHLVPHRGLFTDATRIGSIGNDLALHQELVVARGLGAPIVADSDARRATVRGLGLAGAAATAVDAATTAARASDLRAQGNDIGAQAEVMRFGARNVGGWTGAVVGAKAGAMLGVESGPGLLLTGLAGAGLGAWGSDKLVDWIEQHRIHTQTGRDGHVWRFDPDHPERGWTRAVRELDTQAMAASTVDMPVYKPERILNADAELAQELNCKASRQAVQLRLAQPDVPIDPYRIPADSRDAPSLRDSPWVRDPQTNGWTREVAEGLIDRTMHTRTEVADAVKAAELDAYAQSLIAYNAGRTPAAIARQYVQTHAEQGWGRHGPVPDAVTDALHHPGRLLGSDGRSYERGADGQWTHDGVLWDSSAQDGLRQELDATYRMQQSIRDRGVDRRDNEAQRPEPAFPSANAGARAPMSIALGDDDERMLEQLRDRVRELDRQAGKSWDDRSERLSVAALLMARQNGFAVGDDLRLALNSKTDHYAAGELIHLYRQGPNASADPAANRAHMPTAEALSLPVTERLGQIHDLELAQAGERQRAQQQQVESRHEPSAPRLTV